MSYAILTLVNVLVFVARRDDVGSRNNADGRRSRRDGGKEGDDPPETVVKPCLGVAPDVNEIRFQAIFR